MDVQSEKARAIFFDAIENYRPEQWHELVQSSCGCNSALQEEVAQLLKVYDSRASFMQSPAARQLDLTLSCPPEDDSELVVGKTIGPYKLLEQIGEGGMGTVFMAVQSQPIKRKVALKIIKPGMDTGQVIARFEVERQALAMMNHPNIAKVLDAGATETGRPYFVMELVRGIPVTEFCDLHKLDLRQRLQMFSTVCQAVQHAHQKGIIHRDLKPSNILVELQDVTPVPKVIDFGVAKPINQPLTERTLHTGFAQMIGTPLYMSPEQTLLSSLDVDTRSDVYSLGVLLYEMLTGSTPFDKEILKQAGFDEMRRIIREDEHQKPSERISTLAVASLSTISDQRKIDPRRFSYSLGGELDWIVMKALEKDRARRYESASAFAADVGRYLNDEPVQACPPSTAYRLRKFARRRKGLLTTLTLLLSSLLVCSVVSVWFAVAAKSALQEAVAAKTLADGRLVLTLAAEQEARLQVEIATAVNAFLNDDLLAQASPENTPDPDITLRAVLDRAAELLDTQFPDQPLVEAAVRCTVAQTYRELGEYTQAKKHISRAIQLRTEHKGENDRTTLESRRIAAVIELHQGNYDTAQKTLESLLPTAKNWLGPEDTVTLNIMRNLADAHFRTGLNVQSEALYRETHGVLQRVLGTEDSATLACLRGLAAPISAQGRYAEAETLYRQMLEHQVQRLGDDHPETISLMLNLANSVLGQDRLQEAEEMNLRTLEISRRVLGDEHPKTLSIQHNLANVVRRQGRFDEAEKLHRQTLDVRIRVLGEEHPDTLMSMGGLANTLTSQSRFLEAEEVNQRLLAIRRRTLGVEHPAVLDTLSSVAGNANAQGHYEKAVQYYREVIELRRRVFGEEHTSTLVDMADLSNSLSSNNLLKEAETLRRQVLEIRMRVSGEDHPSTLIALGSLANSLMSQGDYEAAEAIHRQVVAVKSRVLGDEDPGTLVSKLNLAVALYSQQRFPEAESLNASTYESLVRVYGDKHSTTLNCRQNLASCLDALGRFQEAEELRLQSLEFQRLVLGPEHPDTLFSMQNQAKTIFAQGRCSEAKALFHETLEAQIRILGPTHPRTLISKIGHAECLAELGDPETAILEFRQVIASDPKHGSAHRHLGQVLRRTGDLENAVAAFRQAIEADPRDSESYVVWAMLLATDEEPSLRNLQESLTNAMKATELAPHSFRAFAVLGIAQFRNGMVAESVESLEKSRQLRGGTLEADAAFFLAMAYWQADKKADASRCFDEAVTVTSGRHNRFKAESKEFMGIVSP